MPFKGNIDQVVADKDKYNQVDSLDDVKDEFNKQGKYLQVEVRNKIYLVDTAIGYPKFFRELFAKALGAPERADWRTARQDKNLDKLMDKGIENLKNKWKIY